MTKRKTPHHWFVFVIGIVLLGAGLFLINKLNVMSSRQFSARMDERPEFTQNTIPQSVLSWAKTQEQVLGAQYSSVRLVVTPPANVHVPVLMFHYVEYVKDKGDTIRQSLDTTPYTLEQEIVTLQNAGYTFMTNYELSQALDGIRTLPPKPILLTFDDGYRDFYTDAYPILKKYNVKATEYLISGFTGYPNNMTEDQIKEIARDGLVELGVHTVDHPSLKGLPLQKLAYEVFQSKAAIEQMIGHPAYSFAYPNGSFDVAAIEAVRQAGFTSAVSTVAGIDQPQSHRYFLYRLRPGGRTGDTLISWLSSVTDDQTAIATSSGGLVASK